MPKKPTEKKLPAFVRTSTVLVLLALLWLAGCATPPMQPPSAPVRSVQIPPLPSYARQPPLPPECLPSCESRLTTMRESWLNSLQTPTWPGSPANAATTKPEKP